MDMCKANGFSTAQIDNIFYSVRTEIAAAREEEREEFEKSLDGIVDTLKEMRDDVRDFGESIRSRTTK